MELFVVIPCYNEPNVLKSIDSLANCAPPTLVVNVIVVVNSEVNCSHQVVRQNELSIEDLKHWQAKPDWINLTVIEVQDVPVKIAGVGNARKIGMDKAYDLSQNKRDSIIICYDADCTCSLNYLTSIEKAFTANTLYDIATIYFEHEEAGADAIIDYELFLRYHYQGLKFAGYPYAYQTIGSSMAVRAETYNKFGGMNQRKAGEDFYFLHKIIPYRQVLEINNCTVIPSARTSDRVPFGTGHAVAKFQESICKTYYTYDPSIYLEVKRLMQAVESATLTKTSIDGVSSDISRFLISQNFEQAYQQFIKQSKSDDLFRQSVYRWLNGFRMLKLVHYLRDQSYTNVPINQAVSRFWNMKYSVTLRQSNKEWLQRFRSLEKESTIA